MAITAAQVKELREMTGAGMMDCKKALTATDGDFDKAIEWLTKAKDAGYEFDEEFGKIIGRFTNLFISLFAKS